MGKNNELCNQIKEAKQQVRMTALNQRRSLDFRKKKSLIIQAKCIAILDSLLKKQELRVGLYMSLADEVETSEILQYCFEQNILVSVPKVEHGVIRFYEIKNLHEIAPGHFGVLEPITDQCMTAMDLLIIPMVAFDQECNRMGYGKGYYDRYLSAYRGFKVGIAFEGQRVEHLPVDEYDQPLDVILSEEQLYQNIQSKLVLE